LILSSGIVVSVYSAGILLGRDARLTDCDEPGTGPGYECETGGEFARGGLGSLDQLVVEE
jgi:hypothetical protein